MLGPLTKQEEWIPKSHWYQRTFDIIEEDYHVGDSSVGLFVDLMWGLKDVDRSGNNRWTASDVGTLEYDDDFNLAPTANQQRLSDICAQL